jgi:pilus assembly protein CpaC
MMRLLLTLLAALGFLWAALNTTYAEEQTQPPTGIAGAAIPPTLNGEDKPGAVAAQAPLTRADEETAEPTSPPGPRQFGAKRKDARIVIEAKEEAWVRISDAEGALVFMRTMKPGETYRVPNRSGLLLDSGNAKGLVFQVDGNPAPAPVGMVRRGIALDPETLPQGIVARRRAPLEPQTVMKADAAEPPAAETPAPAKSVADKPAAEKRVAENPASEAAGKPIAEPNPVVAETSETVDKPAATRTAAQFEPPPLHATPVANSAAETPAEKGIAETVPAPARGLLTATLPGPLPSSKPSSTTPMPAALPTTEAAPQPTPQLTAVTPPAMPAPAPAEPMQAAAAPAATAAAPAPLAAAKPAPQPQMAAIAPPPAPAPKPAVKPAQAASAPAATAATPATDVGTRPTTLTAGSAPRVVRPVERPSGPVTGAAATTPAGVINAAASRIGLEINKGTLVRLSQPASTVFVADPEIADIQMKTTGLVYIFGKKAGETALYAVDDRERVVLNTTLVVSHNVSRLRAALRSVAPDADVEIVSIDNSLILTGVVHSPLEAENIRAIATRFAPEKGAVINQIQVLAPNQVNLRVRFAEVSKETLKEFGINWESVARIGSNFILAAGFGRDFINAAGVIPREASTNTLAAGYQSGSKDINAAIDALATEGLITVLAEPNLTALNGETASFLAGGEFPVPIAQTGNNGGSSITVEFKTFGVGLAFTPHLLDAGRINLRVRPEVSQLSSAGAVQISGFSIPALTTRRAETTIELGSGQSFVIAGLLQNNTTQDISRVPLLGDLPILGALFRSDSFRRNESELVIIVTPYVVRPVSANRIALPTDGYVAPSDVERILGGITYRPQLNDSDQQPNTKHGQGLIGPSGFQLD